jgi:hypothetical protein
MTLKSLFGIVVTPVRDTGSCDRGIMGKKFKIKLANASEEWADVLEQPSFQRIVDRLATRRPWQIEEIVEAGEAGWVAHVSDGKTNYTLSLTVPVETSKAPPPRIIEWTLEADASRQQRGHLNLPLAAIMFGMGALFAVLGIRLGVRPILVPFVALLGIFPCGLFLGIMTLQPLANRRARKPVAGRGDFLKEVASAVEQLRTEP